MCNLFESTDAYPPRGMKRKYIACEDEETVMPKKRISPFSNTPMERKDLKKQILKMSIQKMKGINNAELCLRKSVLVNNTMKRLHAELKQEKRSVSSIKRPVYYTCGMRQGNAFEVLNNNCSSETFLVDDPFLRGNEDKITDDMTDTLVDNLENRLGVNITSISDVKESHNTNIDTLENRLGVNTTSIADVNELSCSSVQLSNADLFIPQSDRVANCVVSSRYSSCSYGQWDSSYSGFSEAGTFVAGAVQICVSVN